MEAGALISELKRRRVIRALVGYGIVAFAVLQIIEPVMHGFHWPDEVLSYAVVALAVGFPVVVGLAWIFDVNAGHIERTGPAQGLMGTRLALVLVGVGLVAAAPGLVWYFAVRGIARRPAPSAATAEAPSPSIAVLPFADMSPGKDQEYFSDGIAEEILNALAQVEGLHVTGRTSSFSFKGKNEDLRSIGEKLNVGAVLEGSVRKAGNRIRVTAQVIKVADGFHLWSQTYDRDLTDVFAVQDEIAKAVVGALRVKLVTGPPTAAKPHEPSPDAYSDYLLGRQFAYRFNSPESLAAFRRAVARDPAFAPAWAALAGQLYGVGLEGKSPEDYREGCRTSLETVDRALALAPDFPEALALRGGFRASCRWEWVAGLADLDRAVALAPSDPIAMRLSAGVHLRMGRTSEAIAGYLHTIELDPLRPNAWEWLANSYLATGQFDLASRAANRLAQLVPESDDPLEFQADIALLEHQPAAARDWASKKKKADDLDRLWWSAIVEPDLGHAAEAARALSSLEAEFPRVANAAGAVARVYAWHGDRDRAFEWLQRSYEQHEEAMEEIAWDPLLRELRTDPRYRALLKKMNLPLD